MRALFFDEADLCDQIGRPLTCTYWILIRDIPAPVSCESYGIRIRVQQTGETEDVPDVTVLPERITALAQLLVRGTVTPCALREVIEDWL